MDGIIYAELDEKSQCLYDAFMLYDRDIKGELAVTECIALHQDIRFGGISLQQVVASMKYVCAVDDLCHLSELFDLLQEMDRRYYLIQDLRWEFSMLDRECQDTLSEDQSRWLMQSVHGRFFSRKRWDVFLGARPVPGSRISFAEIEVELCNIPNRKEVEDELLEEQKKAEEREQQLRQQKEAEELERKRRLKHHDDERRKQAEDEKLRRQREEEEKRRAEQEERDRLQRILQEEEDKKLREVEENLRKKREEEEKERREKEDAEEAERHKEFEKEQQQRNMLADVSEKHAMMAEMDEKNAEEELRKAEEKMKQAVDDKSRKEAEELERQAREKQIAHRNQKIRLRLKAAVQAKDRVALVPAIQDFEQAKLLDDEQDLEKARRLLLMFNTKDGLKKAMTKRQLDELEKAMNNVKRNGFEVELAPEMAAANKMLLQLRRLERIRAEILELKQATVAEIRSYSSPPEVVKSVMIATFLLHGHKEKETKQWKTVQALVGKTGKDGLKRRCLEFDPDKLARDLETAKRASELLGKFELDEVRDVSAGAATFYVWATSMVEEAEMRLEAAQADLAEEGAVTPATPETPATPVAKSPKNPRKGGNKTGSVKHGKINMSI